MLAVCQRGSDCTGQHGVLVLLTACVLPLMLGAGPSNKLASAYSSLDDSGSAALHRRTLMLAVCKAGSDCTCQHGILVLLAAGILPSVLEAGPTKCSY